MSKLYFFRHAQASYLAKDYDQLSERGELQSAELGKYLAAQQIRFDKLFVGPLKRQQHTCKIVSDIIRPHQPTPDPIILPELKEHSGPEAVKLGLSQLLKTVPQVLQWQSEMQANPALLKRNSLLTFQYFMDEWATGNIEVPGVESWDEFRKEVRKGLDQLLAHTGKGETIGVFTSGGTIASIVAEALHIQDEKRVTAMNFSVRNTSFSSFLFSRSQFNLLSFNELPHLQDDLITFV